MAGVGATAIAASAAGGGFIVCCSEALSCSRSLQIPQAAPVVLPWASPVTQAGAAVHVDVPDIPCPLAMPSRDAHWEHLVGMSINIPLSDKH